MPAALTNALPFTISATLLALFVVPHLPIRNLSALIFALSVPAVFISLWNLLPVEPWAATIAAAEIGLRQSAVIAVIAWVLQDLRRPVENTGHVVVSRKIVGRELDVRCQMLLCI